MNNNKLKSRLHFISASPAPKRTGKSIFSKREYGHVVEESHPNDIFGDFFDYEDDLSNIKPSNELFFEDRNENYSGVTMEEGDFGIMMEEAEVSETDPDDAIDMESFKDLKQQEKSKNNESFIEISDNFCIYHLNDEKRCEHSKESGSLFCVAHQQL